MTYQEALTYLEQLNTFGINLGLTRIKKLLELLGNPERRYKTIHITGTNGKGSTAAMVAAILQEAKIKTGLYTSPHLISYNERFQIDSMQISDDDFADCIATVKECAEAMVGQGLEQPTQFEIITAAAFHYFARQQVEYAVIEVGLGGSLDSTNVLTPEVAVITNVAMDHADRCGGGLTEIAKHKAGIIKNNVPVVTAASGEPLEIIRETAQAKNADLFVAGEEFTSSFKSVVENKQEIEFSCELLSKSKVYQLNLLGKNQIENSALAIMTATIVANSDDRVTDNCIKRALAAVSWPGRFEIVNDGTRLMVIDGAHNPAGVKGLRENIDRYFPGRERVFLIGFLKDKDIHSMIDILIKSDDAVVITKPDSGRAAQPAIVAHEINASQIELNDSIPVAFHHARELAGDDKLLCVAGSLYLVGTVKKLMAENNS